MTYDQIFWTFQTAIQNGGGFYSKLGEAGVLADAENKQLLLKTFPKLISHYGPNSTLYVRPANLKPVELPKS
tara:strand:+ start:1370 stop:1585 length:216 start_codon:yes stop_codon:yes gene_type:complete